MAVVVVSGERNVCVVMKGRRKVIDWLQDRSLTLYSNCAKPPYTFCLLKIVLACLDERIFCNHTGDQDELN